MFFQLPPPTLLHLDWDLACSWAKRDASSESVSQIEKSLSKMLFGGITKSKEEIYSEKEEEKEEKQPLQFKAN